MKQFAIVSTLALEALLAATPSYAQSCYFRAGSRGELCESDGDRGLDATCRYPCAVTVAPNGEKKMMIFKNDKWVAPDQK